MLTMSIEFNQLEKKKKNLENCRVILQLFESCTQSKRIKHHNLKILKSTLLGKSSK